jgi:HK97 family phage major capsid protein
MSDTHAILQQMVELTTAVKAAQSPKTDLRWDAVKDAFGAQIEALVTAQINEKTAAQPVRPGAAIYAQESGALTGNRYAGFVKSFSEGRAHGWGGQRVQPVDLMIAHNMLTGQQKAYIPQIGGVAAAPSDDLRAAIKALDSTTGGAGDELVNTGMAAQLWNDIFLASRVVSTMMRIPMPTNPFDIPLGLGAVTWRKGSENTAVTASNPATAKSTLTATELVAEQNWSYTLDEDAIVALAPEIRRRLAQSGAEIIDAFALNADATDAATGNINLDDADPDADMYYLSSGQDGIRHQWLVDNTAMANNAGGDALVDGDLTAALADMGKYAADPSQLVLVCDVATYLAGFLALTNTTTVDKFGPQATVLTGQLASYRGIPIIVSASHPPTKSDGKADATSNTLGSISIFNRNMWYAGFRRDLLIEVDRDIQKRQYVMVTSLRQAVAAHGTRSTNTHTAGIYNILV